MAPFPAIFALENSGIHICSSNHSDIVTHIEAPIDKQFSVMTTLYVPYIYSDDSHVELWRDFDYSWSGRKRNIIEDVILFEDSFNIHRREFLLGVCMRVIQYADDFQIRFRLGES